MNLWMTKRRYNLLRMRWWALNFKLWKLLGFKSNAAFCGKKVASIGVDEIENIRLMLIKKLQNGDTE